MPSSANAMMRSASACAELSERRRHRRLTVAGCAARLDAPADSGLCNVLNLSDGGILLETPIDLACGNPVRISFDCTNSVQGRVVWRIGRRAGVRFLAPLASSSLVSKVAGDRWSGAARAPRLTLNQPAQVTSGTDSFAIVVVDMSQRGMSIQHRGEMPLGAAVAMVLDGSPPITGSVRWTHRSLAGIKLDGKLTVDFLSSRRRLRFIEAGAPLSPGVAPPRQSAA
jgi:hypothetical protein